MFIVAPTVVFQGIVVGVTGLIAVLKNRKE